MSIIIQHYVSCMCNVYCVFPMILRSHERKSNANNGKLPKLRRPNEDKCVCVCVWSNEKVRSCLNCLPGCHNVSGWVEGQICHPTMVQSSSTLIIISLQAAVVAFWNSRILALGLGVLVAVIIVDHQHLPCHILYVFTLLFIAVYFELPSYSITRPFFLVFNKKK